MTSRFTISRFTVVFAVLILITAAVILRLFYLQVIRHGYYAGISESEQQGYTTLPARRGEILVEDYHSGESYALAANTTLSMIYADPTLIKDPKLVADTLSPLLFDLDQEKELDAIRYEDDYEAIQKMENEALRTEALSKLAYKTDEELAASFAQGLETTLATRTKDVILYTTNVDAETQAKIKTANIKGTELTENGNFYLYPEKIADKSSAAEKISEIFNVNKKELETTLLGTNRYVELKHRLAPEITEQIEKILEDDRAQAEKTKTDPNFLGIVLKEEYFRFYPEQSLAAQVLGYTNSAGTGLYGIEGTFEDILHGQDGIFTSQVDAYGNQITVGKTVIEEGVNGADITLTLDRAIQSEIETLLEKGVKDYRPDSGQVIVMNPKTGAVLAMAQYPTFNPNSYSDVFKKVEIAIPEDKKDRIILAGTEDEPIYWYYIQVDPDVRIQIFPDSGKTIDPLKESKWYSYENLFGPEVYKNKTTQEVYEPGSVFKPLTMAAAIDAGEVTPNQIFMDTGPLGVDFNKNTGEYDYYIETYNGQYHGPETMTQILEHSCNVGMSYVAKLLGPELFYSYIKAFGLTERTGIGFTDEVMGRLAHYSTWTESELVTKAFGQGISMTPIQLMEAYTALANNGAVMKPYIVKKITYADGRTEEFEPEVVKQVISEETSKKIIAMMTDVVESYASISIPGHYFAGKSGTAQTYKHGQALSGVGTTEASFMGIGPIEDPEFLVIVKMDHPRTNEYAEPTSGQVLKQIMAFLYDYYSIPPDKD
jgi:stage V sporulation protein D (sporulation-specific penicillin-binding protein)